MMSLPCYLSNLPRPHAQSLCRILFDEALRGKTGLFFALAGIKPADIKFAQTNLANCSNEKEMRRLEPEKPENPEKPEKTPLEPERTQARHPGVAKRPRPLSHPVLPAMNQITRLFAVHKPATA
jgi:hypothetical protein